MSQSSSSVLRFNDCEFDPDRRELRRNGEVVPLEPRVFALLLYLIEQRHRAVDKDEIQDTVWAGMIVSETALTRAIMKARRAVGDSADTQAIIRTVHGHGYQFTATLTNLLAGEVELDQVLATSEWSGLEVIPAGTPSPHAPNLLGSQKMNDLLQQLSERFDLVVIDSPPLMAAADARILSRVADATVLIVRWGKTRRPVARLAVRQLQAAGARLAGGLLTMVDVKRNAKYSYGDSGAYSGDLEKYYAG